jgi:hypothetical protein
VSIAASSTAGLSPTTGYFGSRVLKQDGPASFDMIFAHGKDSPGRFYFRKPIRPQTSGVLKYGDAIVLASTTWSGYTSNCGWYGCRVLTADGVDEKEASLVHGYRAPTVVYVRPWNGKEEGELVEYGDEIVLSATPYGGYTCNCGWHGCRVLTQNGTSPVSFQHGAASPQTFFILPPPGVSATQVQYNDAVVLSVDGTGGCGGFGCSVLQPLPSNTRELTLASGGSNPPSFKVRAPVEPAGGTNAQSPEEDCVRFGDEVVVSLESKDYTDNCGWYGCRTLLQVPANPVDAQLNHGLGKPQSFLIEPAEGQESLAGQCLTRGKKIVLSTGSHFATRDQNERLKFQPIGTTPTFFYVR